MFPKTSQDCYISTHDLTKRSTQHFVNLLPGLCISTHDLTKRSTIFALLCDSFKFISTHDLTKRSTLYCQISPSKPTYFNSRPHEEVDAFLFRPGNAHIFQLTTSRRGRRRSCGSSTVEWYFNSRPHEEVDHKPEPQQPQRITFQLTTSRRGRRQFLRKKFSFPNYFLCLLHIIYSYYINTIFFSTLFFAKSSFFLVRIP